jgi:hypothetical protein
MFSSSRIYLTATNSLVDFNLAYNDKLVKVSLIAYLINLAECTPSYHLKEFKLVKGVLALTFRCWDLFYLDLSKFLG